MYFDFCRVDIQLMHAISVRGGWVGKEGCVQMRMFH